MPTYEYICQTCHSPISIWFRSFAAAETETPVCTVCGGSDLKRQMSACAVIHSHSSGQTRKHDSALTAGSSVEDSQSLAHILHEAGAGRDMSNDFKEVASRLEKGEGSQAVEASLRKRVGERMQPH